MAEKIKSPAFQFYPKDWISDAKVCELSLEEEGAYIRLLSHCWLEGSIPADPARCARIIGKGCTIELAKSVQRMFSEERTTVQVSLNEKRTDVQRNANESSTNMQRLVHKRLNEERDKQKSRRVQASEAGRKSGAKRRNPANSAVEPTNDRSIFVERKVNPSSSSSSTSSTAVLEDKHIAAPAAVAERDASPPPYNLIASQYVAAFGGTTHITDKRRKTIRARWQDPWWRENWQAALDRGSQSDFLKGGGSTGWRISLDFFLKQDSVARILEGVYDNGNQANSDKRQLTAAERREQLNADSFQYLRDAVAAQQQRTSSTGIGNAIPPSTGATLLLEEHGTAHTARG